MINNFKKYICLEKNYYSRNGYSIIPIRKSDMESIRQWRNEQIDILRQKYPITKDEQRRYYENNIKPLFNKEKPIQILFSYLLKDELIGYGGLTNIDWESKRAEISFLLETSKNNDSEIYSKEFSIFLDLIKRVSFEEMLFHKLFTETYDIRQIHINILGKNGFILEGRLKEHKLIDGRYIDSLIHACFRR